MQEVGDLQGAQEQRQQGDARLVPKPTRISLGSRCRFTDPFVAAAIYGAHRSMVRIRVSDWRCRLVCFRCCFSHLVGAGTSYAGSVGVARAIPVSEANDNAS